MIKDKNLRLGGSYYDSEEIKNHPYFKDVNWDMIGEK